MSEHRALSELARQAFTGQHDEPLRTVDDPGHLGFVTLARRGAAVSNALIDRLREEAGG